MLFAPIAAHLGLKNENFMKFSRHQFINLPNSKPIVGGSPMVTSPETSQMGIINRSRNGDWHWGTGKQIAEIVRTHLQIVRCEAVFVMDYKVVGWF